MSTDPKELLRDLCVKTLTIQMVAKDGIKTRMGGGLVSHRAGDITRVYLADRDLARALTGIHPHLERALSRFLLTTTHLPLFRLYIERSDPSWRIGCIRPESYVQCSSDRWEGIYRQFCAEADGRIKEKTKEYKEAIKRSKFDIDYVIRCLTYIGENLTRHEQLTTQLAVTSESDRAKQAELVNQSDRCKECIEQGIQHLELYIHKNKKVFVACYALEEPLFHKEVTLTRLKGQVDQLREARVSDVRRQAQIIERAHAREVESKAAVTAVYRAPRDAAIEFAPGVVRDDESIASTARMAPSACTASMW